MKPHRAVAFVLASACARTVQTQGSADASPPLVDAGPVHDAATDASIDAPPDVPPVNTCSAFRLRSADLGTPAPAVYPGALLLLHGDGLGSATRVSVGGVDAPLERPDATSLAVRVPPMLAVGPQSVTVASDRCMASLTVSVSRLVAWAASSGGPIFLHDLVTLDRVGSVNAGPVPMDRLVFTTDGEALVAHDVYGQLSAARAWGGDDVIFGDTSTPFFVAGGTVVPTSVLVASGGALPLVRLDTDPVLSSHPIPGIAGARAVACPLDGSRALVLEASGAVTAVDLPFSVNVRTSPLVSASATTRAVELAMGQGAATTATGPLAALFEATSPPDIVAIDSASGTILGRAAVPFAAGGLTFLSGDVVAVSATTPELLTGDLGAAGVTVLRYPLAGELPDPTLRTVFAASGYRVGVVALRGGLGVRLHVFDFHREPAVEERSVELPGIRGVAGVQGAGDPFVVWTATEILRVNGADGTIAARVVAGSSAMTIGALAVAP